MCIYIDECIHKCISIYIYTYIYIFMYELCGKVLPEASEHSNMGQVPFLDNQYGYLTIKDLGPKSHGRYGLQALNS